MNRRHLLRTAVSLPLLSGSAAGLLSGATAAKAATTRIRRRSRPGDAAWPHAASWARLNEAHAIDLAAAELRRIVPVTGSYVSESNYFNRDWRNAYWGRNYSRLRSITSKYDPDGLFFVHHGVGSDDWSAEGFTRPG
jgi:hypothetical protein